jgi:O-antigen/teichoic acid export membrane protein
MNLPRNIATTLSARVALLVVALASSIVLARSLGPEGRGLFALVFLIPGFARSFGLLGFEQANAVYAGLQPQGRRALVWHSALVACLVGGAVAISGMAYVLVGAPGVPNLIQGPLWLYTLPLLMIPVGLLLEFWLAILRGMNHIVLLNVVQVATKIIALVLLVVFVYWMRLEVLGAVWTVVAADAVAIIVVAFCLSSAGVLGAPFINPPLWKRTARFALPAHGGTIAAYFNYRVDEFIIAALLTARDLGFYAIATSLVERMWILPSAVTTALLPHLTNATDRDPKLVAIVARHVMIWTGIACVCLFAIAEVLVDLLFSSAFGDAAAPLRWLMPGIFTLSIGKVLVTELLAREKALYTIWASVSAAIVNIAGNLLLIPYMGISGAAVASSISYTILSLIIIYYYLRETRLPGRILIPCREDFVVYVDLFKACLPPALMVKLRMLKRQYIES